MDCANAVQDDTVDNADQDVYWHWFVVEVVHDETFAHAPYKDVKAVQVTALNTLYGEAEDAATGMHEPTVAVVAVPYWQPVVEPLVQVEVALVHAP